MKESTIRYESDYAVKPGETIHDLLEEHKMSIGAAAYRLGITIEEFLDVLAAKKRISTLLAFGLEKLFNVKAEFWINLQINYEKDIVRLSHNKKDVSDEEIENGDCICFLANQKELLDIVNVDNVLGYFCDGEFYGLHLIDTNEVMIVERDVNND